jgi:phosphoribosylformimino-5-aminoimidazole carboxamide ribotide isomerase
MEVYFAVDVLGGSAVRLLHGDYAKKTVYYPDAADAARALLGQGAGCLHVVDLDGARGDRADNFAAISRIAAAGAGFVQVGGGIRSMERIAAYLDAGVDRVILGTAAVKDPALLDAAIARYGARVAVGVDARDGCVAVEGWRETSALEAGAFCASLAARGVSCVIYTDISRDGALRGVNLEAYRALLEIPGLTVIASGGVAGADDLSALAALGVHGAIVGRALYEGKLDVAAALRAAGRADA